MILNNLFSVLVVFLLLGCSQSIKHVGDKIEITPEYIVNDNWTKVSTSIKISKMRLKTDSVLNIYNLNQADALSKLEEDSSFVYYANVAIDIMSDNGKKVFFNQDNGFYWSGEESNVTTRVVGKLEMRCWYKFSYLVTFPYQIYIYVDSTNAIHRFDVNLSNY